MTVTRWKKSRLSAEQTDCVQLAHTLDQVRDTKNPDGPALIASVPSLLELIKNGWPHR